MAPSVLEEVYKNTGKHTKPSRRQNRMESARNYTNETPSHIVDHNYVNSTVVRTTSRDQFQTFNLYSNNVGQQSTYLNNHVPPRVINHFEPYNHLDNVMGGPCRSKPMNVNNHHGAARAVNHFEPYRQLDNHGLPGPSHAVTMDTTHSRLDNYPGPSQGLAAGPHFGDTQNNDDLMFIDRRLSIMDVTNDLPPV